jgi:hypothetical protein
MREARNIGSSGAIDARAMRIISAVRGPVGKAVAQARRRSSFTFKAQQARVHSSDIDIDIDIDSKGL